MIIGRIVAELMGFGISSSLGSIKSRQGTLLLSQIVRT